MSAATTKRQLRNLPIALAFLTPNICGVLLFLIFPVAFSIVMAFSDWDLRLHNMYKEQSPDFVGLDNFIRLFAEPDFLKFLGNTLFLMMGIPFSVGGSLFAAVLLSQDTRGGGGSVFKYVIATGILIASCAILVFAGAGASATTLLVIGLGCVILVAGVLGGTTVYRTLFYAPHFTAGIATFLLWKKLYNPETGPINMALKPALDALSSTIDALPAGVVQAIFWIGLMLMGSLVAWGLRYMRRGWIDGDIGWRATIIPVVFILIPTLAATRWSYTQDHAWFLWAIVGAAMAWNVIAIVRAERVFECSPNEGTGNALMLALGVMVLQFVILGLCTVCYNLPTMVAGTMIDGVVIDAPGLEPPPWLTDYHWAKPSLMLIGFWGAIGSNSMLLYLAALTNVPQELYEAADIDGAQRFQRFWHVTWPQLAPTTFFIVVMATIGGLQGGFEVARALTNGGPAQATTTLSYFIYIEGFETGRLGYASAVAWALFLLVFGMTLFNWKFGNKYVND